MSKSEEVSLTNLIKELLNLETVEDVTLVHNPTDITSSTDVIGNFLKRC